MKQYYITTAIPYANAKPHIGTAMDYLYGDILLRYQTSVVGQPALMSIGTDEHGTKVAQKAADNNLSPRQWVDNLQADFDDMRRQLNLDFKHIKNVRTTDADHVRRCQAIWRRLDEAGFIYLATYEGWYCSGCEGFITETEARQLNYNCPDHQKKLEQLSEQNYFLKVSLLTDQIRQFIKSSVVPEFRGREILELIKDGAKDVSISRPRTSLDWGIPVPDDDSQVMYVWVDALSNYLTVIGYPDDNNYQNFWPADVEIVGKDILRFHAIIWPAILLGLNLPLPKKLLVHGFVNVDGAKMSKSLGNVVSPLEIINQYGTDAFRYFFARHIPLFEDGDFSWQKFEAAYNGELANDLGNLVSRTANMIKQYNVKDFQHYQPSQPEKLSEKRSLRQYQDAMAKFDLNTTFDIIWQLIQNNNKFIDQSRPWKLAKTDRKSLENIMRQLAANLRFIGQQLGPFLPATAAKIEAIFSAQTIPAKLPILFPKQFLHSPKPTNR